jgi:hypothetical protein
MKMKAHMEHGNLGPDALYLVSRSGSDLRERWGPTPCSHARGIETYACGVLVLLAELAELPAGFLAMTETV